MYSSGGFRPHLGLLRRLGPQLLASRAPAGGVLLRARRPLQQHSRASYHSGSGRTTRTLPSAVGPHPARAAATTTAPVTGRYYLVLRRGSGLITVCSLLALALQHPGAGCAAGGDGRPPRRRPAAEEDEEDDVEARLRRALDAALGPLGGEISFGCIVGFTAGYALKKVGKTVAVVIGVTYLAAQTLTSLGYVDVNWKKLERQLVGLLGGKDDGYKLSKRDLDYYWAKLQEALTYQLPSTGGFVTGFAIGFYKG